MHRSFRIVRGPRKSARRLSIEAVCCWKSEDAGRSWRALWHKQESLAIGSLAIDPSNLDVLYCGTGEANMASDCAPGVGMYRTDDSGLTWRLLASAKEQGLPLHIGAVTVDPFDSRHIYLGGVDLGRSNSAGLFVSHDGGASWRREGRVSPAAVSCHAVMFHPSREGMVLAVVEDPRGAGGIWRSVDGGQSWIHVETGLPEPNSFGRASLAVAPFRTRQGPISDCRFSSKTATPLRRKP
jgi:photosystem II stability/assembly factor-like uncharacterized protein